jgi:hypothetical protein
MSLGNEYTFIENFRNAEKALKIKKIFPWETMDISFHV